MMNDQGVTVEDLDEIDGLIAEPEKKKSTGKTKKKSSSPLVRRLDKMIGLLGNVVEGFDSYDADVLRDNSKDIAEALADLANESPRVRAILEGSLEGGAWTAVGLVVGMKVVLPITVHHDLLPDPMNSNVAGALDVPVRKRKKRPRRESPGYTIPEKGDLPDDIEDAAGKIYGRVRHPETGEMVTVELNPETGRPYVDGDGVPVVPDDAA